MNRDEVKSKIDELMRQYQDEEIDGDTYLRKIMELNKESKNISDDDEDENQYYQLFFTVDGLFQSCAAIVIDEFEKIEGIIINILKSKVI